MKTILSYVAIAVVLFACDQRKSDNQFDSNAAEATSEPGDLKRKNGDTNEEAAKRAKDRSSQPPTETHPALKDVGDSVAVIKPGFATTAADAGFTEIHLAELATKKTTNESIRQFAEMMMKDHSAANEELKKIAADKGIELPTACLTCDATYRTLHDLDTDEFNERYVQMMVDDHERVVKLFSLEATKGEDADLKAWASEKLPLLKHHLSMAQKLTDNTGVTAGRPKEKRTKKSK